MLLLVLPYLQQCRVERVSRAVWENAPLLSSQAVHRQAAASFSEDNSVASRRTRASQCGSSCPSCNDSIRTSAGCWRRAPSVQGSASAACSAPPPRRARLQGGCQCVRGSAASLECTAHREAHVTAAHRLSSVCAHGLVLQPTDRSCVLPFPALPSAPCCHPPACRQKWLNASLKSGM